MASSMGRTIPIGNHPDTEPQPFIKNPLIKTRHFWRSATQSLSLFRQMIDQSTRFRRGVSDTNIQVCLKFNSTAMIVERTGNFDLGTIPFSP
jgi:hypothetical protein